MIIKTAVLLGGGSSSRFYPFNRFNKSTISLMGKSLFQRTIDGLKEAGIETIIVIDDSKNSLSRAFSSDVSGVTFITQKESLGMGDALLLAKDYISENSFFVLSSYHFEFSLFAQEMVDARNSDSDIVIVTKQDTETSQFGGISVANGKVQVHEKSGKSFASRIVAMYLLNTAFLDTLADKSVAHYNFEDAISDYEHGGIVLLEAKRNTISLKFPWDLLSVKDYLLENMHDYRATDSEISESAKINGTVYISKGVKIMDGAVITGPAYLGENVYVGSNAILRGGVVLERGVVIGAGMEVKNSVVFDESTTHSGFIGDSVIGKKVKIAAGFITGNVRIDRKDISTFVKNEKISTNRKYLGVFIGDDSSVGIHVGTMPGVIIGSNVVIGPGTTVMRNVSENMSYYTEFKEIIEKN